MHLFRHARSAIVFLSVGASTAGNLHASEPGNSSRDSNAAATITLPAVGAIDDSSSALRRAIEHYATDRAGLQRLHGETLSPVGTTRMRRFYEQWRAALTSIQFERLDQDGRIDALLFRNHLDHALRDLEHGTARDDEIGPLVPFASMIEGLQDSRRRLEAIDSAKVAGRLADLPKQIDALQEKLATELEESADEDSRPAHLRKTVANRAARRVTGLQRTLKAWYGFYNGYDPEFTWWVRQPYEEADRALKKHADFLREKLVGVKADDRDAVIGDPIGRDALLDELASAMIAYTPEELIAIAEREFAWCDREMLRASRELGFGDDWRKALEHVKTLHVAPGKQPKLIRDLARESIAFLEERDLVTIPALCREIWRMQMMTPERQKVNPYFTGGETISVSFPTDGMTHEQKLMSMRGNNIHFARATVHHELIPGHHLQGFMAARHRTHRQLFRTPFLVEGWALYWEMLLWDLDFPQSAEDRVGMLFWRTHRCARIIFSLKFHLEQMTAQEAIEFLIERVGHERNNATAEIRRSVQGNYGPLYQCAYMLGGLQIRALHREVVGSGRMSNRAFHDAVLRENSIPIEMIRASLTHQPLTADYASRWRFADPGL